jgi:ketosteroid isomerase-like protein
MKEKEFSPDTVRVLLKLFDQTAIRDVIGRYFYCLDRRDFAALTTCFTSDAHGEYDDGKTVHVGREAIIEALRGITQFKFSSHLIGSLMVEVNGDLAKADTFGVAFLVVDGGEGKGRVLVRGLRYLDNLVQVPEGWRINHRVHIPIWQYEAASVPPALPQAK